MTDVTNRPYVQHVLSRAGTLHLGRLDAGGLIKVIEPLSGAPGKQVLLPCIGVNPGEALLTFQLPYEVAVFFHPELKVPRPMAHLL